MGNLRKYMLPFSYVILCGTIISCTSSSPTEPVDKQITKIYSLSYVGDSLYHHCIKYADFNSEMNFGNILADFFTGFSLSFTASPEYHSLVIGDYWNLYFFDTDTNKLLCTTPVPASDFDVGDRIVSSNWMKPMSESQSILIARDKLFFIDHNHNSIGKKIYESDALIVRAETSPDNKWIYLVTEKGLWGGQQFLIRVHLELGYTFLIDELMGARGTDEYPAYYDRMVGDNVIVWSDGLKWRKYSTATNELIEDGNFPEYVSFTVPIRQDISSNKCFFYNQPTNNLCLFDMVSCEIENCYQHDFDFMCYGFQRVSDGIYAFIRDTNTLRYEIINLNTKEVVSEFYNPRAYRFLIFEE